MEDSSRRGRPGRVLRVAASAGVMCAAVLTPGPATAQAPTAVAAELVAAGNYDYNGDGRDDIVARRDANGNLEVWPGDGAGGFGPRATIALGWDVFDLIETAGDLDADGHADLIARRADNGVLYFFAGSGAGLGSGVRIGSDWDTMSAVVAGHDYDGDGKADILATEAATGTLWLYPGTGTGTHGRRFRIGSDFDQVQELTAVGDLNEDGHADIVGVGAADECMYFYAGPGSERFAPKVRFDCGWDVMESAAAVGDFDGDGHADWVGRESATGLLYLFKGNGAGGYDSSPVIDVGWGSMTIA
ncbi:FG-GAP repeat domain-containing protein [Glycomyces algeriensis]|uniref:VCBS repeat protein n=1 Tax=Glycomyces algeriensis TaxID=256037 RepID=A0A9W6LJ56_9ACTN|nr:VCBS repeat-containing protein [Glycomyces algeriensis]MDA1368569.1 VCBS repeat-containing protein [Glycomyces algeriensis]MDR7352368.1 hypothetical protein [Glycomyces algeriensis]GLI45105.1 hypothetical protein GALLR39Z86_49550 [Glycomyces algeriensis]